MHLKPIKRRGKTVLTLTLASVSTIGLVFLASTASRSAHADISEGSISVGDVFVPLVETPSPARTALLCGLTPNSAAVAGLSEADLDLAFAYCQAQSAAARSCMSIDAEIERLEQEILIATNTARTSGFHDRELIRELQSKIDDLAVARDEADGELRRGLRLALAARVGNNRVEMMENYVANLGRRVPDRYRCLDLTEDEWAALASGLDKRAINAARAASESDEGPVEFTELESSVLTLTDRSTNASTAEARLDAASDETLAMFERQSTGR